MSGEGRKGSMWLSLHTHTHTYTHVHEQTKCVCFCAVFVGSVPTGRFKKRVKRGLDGFK